MSNVQIIDDNQGEDFGFLITTEIVDGKELRTVKSARLFYEALGYDISHWSSWSKTNITNNRFAIQDVDYQPLATSASKGRGNFAQDFKLTLDFAERLAMMAKTELGENVRRYFQRERNSANKMREIINIHTAPKEMIVAQAFAIIQADVARLEEKTKELEAVVSVQERKLESKSAKEDFTDYLMANDEFNITPTAIGSRLGLKADELNIILLENGIIKKLEPDYTMTAKYLNKGYGRRVPIPCRDGKTRESLRWSRFGEAFIVNFVRGLDRSKYKNHLITI